MKTIEEEWESYKQAVYGGSLPPDQDRECKMAFYAGCACMFGLMNTAAELEETRAVKEVSKLHNQLHEFNFEVKRKYKSDSSEQAENPEYQ